MTTHRAPKLNPSDLFALVVLVITAVIFRVGAVGCLSINPDENQYEAHASYLVATDQSTFATPIGPVHANGLFELFARMFGPYSLPQVRLLVLCICIAMAASIYLVVRRELSVWYALLASIVFVVYGNYFEGLSANREWFAGLAVWCAMLLYGASLCLSGRGSWAFIGAAGLVCGLAVWIKDQAIVLTLPIAADLGYEALARRGSWRVARQITTYLGGLLLAAALYWLPFVLVGTAAEHWDFLVNMRLNYAGHRPSQSLSHLGQFWLHGLYLDLPFRGVWLLAFAESCVVLFLLVWAIVRPAAGNQLARGLRLIVFYFLASLMAICLGSRFFPHYFLFALPPLGVLSAYGLRDLCDRASQPRSIILGAVVILAWCGERLWIVLHEPDAILGAAQRGSLTWLLCFVLALVMLGRRFWKRNEATDRASTWRVVVPLSAAALFCVQVAQIGADAIGRLNAPLEWGAANVKDFAYADLGPFIHKHAQQGDRVFVWGWRPEIYSMLSLEAATQFATGMEVMRDIDQDGVRAPEYDRKFSRLLLNDLEQRQPRFIIDAWVHSIHGSRYRLKFYPPLGAFLKSHYRLDATIDCCDIYVRRDDREAVDAPRTEDATRDETLLRTAVERWPDEGTIRLNWGDFLALEGRPKEARAVYEQLRQRQPTLRLLDERLQALSDRERSRAE